MPQEEYATRGGDSGEWLEYAPSGVRNWRMKRWLQVWEEEQVPGWGRRRSMIRKKRLQEKNEEEVRRKRRTTIDDNEKYEEVEYEEEASRGWDFRGGECRLMCFFNEAFNTDVRGKENASGGVSRTRKRQECPWGKAPRGACYRRTLQKKEAPGGRGSRYKRLHEMGAPWGGSRRRRLQE